MNRMKLWPIGYLLLAACFGSAATGVGESETSPLVRVDGAVLPVTIADQSGTTASITGGTLTVYDTRATCDYVINFSSGKKVSGQASCLSVLVTPITNGVELHLDIGEAGVPQGTHNYDFVNSIKPCTCPKFCICSANRLIPSDSTLTDMNSESRRIRDYRFGLTPR